MNATMGFVFVTAATTTTLLIFVLQPILQRYALARPNARSSHRVPTPQGGGIAVIAAMTFVLAATFGLATNLITHPFQIAAVFGATLCLAILGTIDDIRPLPPFPRLLMQAGAIVIVLWAFPSEFRLLSWMPFWIERALLAVGLLWFVNLVNFMDGIDWMTVAEVVPITGALAAFGLMGALPHDAMLVSLALCGAMVGFAPFNRPVARLFLGDVGSLPIGLMLGWLLIVLAANHLVAALLLPLYYLTDATITLLRRLARGDPIMQAHRSHFYQQAVDGGHNVYRVVGCIFAINIVLAALATATLTTSVSTQLLMVLCGSGLVAAVLIHFNQPKKPPVH